MPLGFDEQHPYIARALNFMAPFMEQELVPGSRYAADFWNQAAQNQLNQVTGPQSQGRSFLNKLGHSTAMYGAYGMKAGAALGAIHPAEALLMLDPAVAGAYFGAKQTGALTGIGEPSLVKQTIQNPTPGNVLATGMTALGAVAPVVGGFWGNAGIHPTVAPGEAFRPGFENAEAHTTVAPHLPVDQNAVAEYNRNAGLPTELPASSKVAADPRGGAIADAYDAMQHSPNDPAVRASYDALISEVKNQYHFATDKLGMKFDLSPDEAYSNAQEMVNDVRNNRHLTIFSGGQPPLDHPLSAIDPETGLSYNTLFRGVHDVFGHAIEGHDFSEAGEESAFTKHAQMFSPEAMPALTTETKGQASWFYNNKAVRDGAPVGNFPEQKAALLPSEFHTPQGSSSPITVSHWSVQPDLTELDTNAFGTSSIGAAERSRAKDAGFLPRVYMGIPGVYQEPPITRRPYRYEATIDPARYYDIESDPQDIWRQGFQSGGATAAEAAVKDAGYAGYRSPTQGAFASFENVPVKLAQRPAWADDPSTFLPPDTSSPNDPGLGRRGMFARPSGGQAGAARADMFLAPFEALGELGKRFKSIVPDSIAQHLPEEWQKSLRSPISQAAMLNMRKNLMSAPETAALAQLGQGFSHGWYDASNQLPYALQDVDALPKGVDPIRFSRTGASMSPQNPVARNLAENLETMRNLQVENRYSDPTASPETFQDFLFRSGMSDPKTKIYLPHGGEIAMAGSKWQNMLRAMSDQPMSGLKVNSFGSELAFTPELRATSGGSPVARGVVDTISGKGLGMGADVGKVFDAPNYMAARSRLSEAAKYLGTDVDHVQETQWSTTKVINDSKALQTADPGDVIKHIQSLGADFPRTDFSAIALDALEGKYKNNPAYSAWNKDYTRVDNALRKILGSEDKINAFKESLRNRTSDIYATAQSRPLGEASGRLARSAVRGVQQSIRAAAGTK